MDQSAPSTITRPHGLRPDIQQHMPEENGTGTWQGFLVQGVHPTGPQPSHVRKSSVYSQHLTGIFCRWLAKLGRICRFVLGEGIEKKTNDLAKEVETQTKAMEEAAKKAAAPADSAASPSEAAAEPAQVAFMPSLACMAVIVRKWPSHHDQQQTLVSRQRDESRTDEWREQFLELRRPCMQLYSPTECMLLHMMRILPSCRRSAVQVKIDAKAVKQLRQASGAGMMDAKKALIETGGDVDKAMEFLRKKGLASADKKAGRLASEGAIGAYIHAGSR